MSTLRPDAYQGGSRMAVPFPGASQAGGEDGPAQEESDEAPADDDGAQGDAGDAQTRRRPSPARRRGPSFGRLFGSGRAPGQSSAASALRVVRDQGAGVVVAALVWVWVVLPYIDGGASEVGDTLRAKFFNKGPDGAPL